MITHKEVTELVQYCPDTGIFTWKTKTCRKVVPGKSAGSKNANGYIQIKLNKQFYYGHRLAWFFVHHEWPTEEIDHVNGDPSDNRLCNLRQATSAQNKQNRQARKDCKSGIRGVYLRKDTQKWKAELRHNKKLISLGSFNTLDEAAMARKVAEMQLFTHHRSM